MCHPVCSSRTSPEEHSAAGMGLMHHYSHPNNPLQIAEQTAFVFRRWMDGGGYAKESSKRLGLRRLPPTDK